MTVEVENLRVALASAATALERVRLTSAARVQGEHDAVIGKSVCPYPEAATVEEETSERAWWQTGYRQTMAELENARLEAEVQRLQAFKDWVHAYLDAKGVPKEFPDGQHTREGCRIGDRLDWLVETNHGGSGP